MQPPGSIYEAFSKTAALYAGKPALMQKDGRGAYQPITFTELHGFVSRLARSLRKLGIGKGDRVAILACNGPEWVIADMAALKCGAMVVPLYTTLSRAALKYIVSDSGSKLVFAGDSELFAVVDSIRREVDSVREVVVFDPSGIEQGKTFTNFWTLAEEVAGDVLTSGAAGGPSEASAGPPQLPGTTSSPELPPSSPAGSTKGQVLRPSGPSGTRPEPEWPAAAPDDPATIVYTSGTTGEPKGVMLSHGNILSNVYCSIRRFGLSSEDRFLSFLPLSHMFERAGSYSILLSGGTIAYAGDMTTILQDARKIRPTALIVVPRILEKVYEAAQGKVAESPAFRRKLVRAAVQNLTRRVNLRYRDRRVPIALSIKCLFYDWLVARKFRNIAGGKLRFVLSGAAPLNARVAKILCALGFNVFEGYGLTETSPGVCSTCFADNRLGTVGKPYDGVEVKIEGNSEVLVRGPNVMKGYFNKPQESVEVIDTDGWFHTGDQGRLDRHGNLIITGRIKELIVTSYGKNIAPVPIETAIKQSDYIEDVMLHGDKEKYATAIVVTQREAVERYARENGVDAAGYEQLLEKEEIRALISSEIKNATKNCSPFEKVRAFTLVGEGFTVANDLLTPSLKLRREKVREKYHNAIEAMYGRG